MNEINLKALPNHIAIIMDGNGRWAKKRVLPRAFGHKQGVKTVKKVVIACKELGIKVLTLYAFSTENWKRPETEIKVLCSLIKSFIKSEFEELNNAGVKVNVLGDYQKFPGDVVKELDDVCKKTSSNKELILNIALNYGARQEILRACKIAVEKNLKNISEENFSSLLYTAGQPDPDLLIRTSGELRISNFLLWQIAYSEIYITKKLWPDFEKKDLIEAIKEYQKRDRRFGGL